MKTRKLVKMLDVELGKVIVRREIVLICKRNFRDATVLSQLLYWADKLDDREFYWSNTSAEEQIGITRRALDGAVTNLVAMEYINVRGGVAEGHNTRFFKVNTDKIAQALNNLVPEQDEELDEPKALDVTEEFENLEQCDENFTEDDFRNYEMAVEDRAKEIVTRSGGTTTFAKAVETVHKHFTIEDWYENYTV